MNRISGRVVLKESGAGIPDLLVVVFDVDPDTRPEEQIPTSPASASLPFLEGDGDRIGGVLTKAHGEFELTFEDTEFQIRNEKEKRPDLLLSVWAPEEPGVDPATRLLYTSNSLRQNAGRTEEYLVRLNADVLRKAGLDLPSNVPRDAEPAADVLTRSAEHAQRLGTISDGSIQIAQARMDLHRARFAGFHTKVKPALAAALSKLPTAPIGADRVVRAGESPFLKCRTIIKGGIRDVVNSDDPAKRAPRRGYLSLTSDDVDELKAQAAPDGTVTEDAVKAIAQRNGRSPQTTYVEALDRLPLCLPRSIGSDCATPLLDPPVATPDPEPESPGAEEPADTITAEDIPRYLARLMEPLTAPEDQLLTGITPSATRESVATNVKKLLFPPGPADAPAFHDFNTLQIAFDYVWQEAIDQGILDIAQDAYETIVELGGDPTRPEYETHGPLSAIVAEGRATLKASRPIEVRDHRGESSTSRPPRDHNGMSDDTCGASSGLVVRDHRTGSLPISNWSPATTSSEDPTERLPQLLQDLERRLLQNYNFTVYAANAKERSVNFGILNTYRQIWTPLSYQAGSLVKSIPLAPKQSQKVVVNRKTTRKRARKELEHNLRVTKEETSQTSRTEQEIARRAQTRTDFSVENTAGENTGVNNASTTIKMSHEASKSSDDIKKAMHENTFKAAQECRRELTTEITTEETEEADYSETTEISNPNDEIAVTYLFYELQRRYRLFERLYRVRPVVLVAQEFPQPHEINQAWLVAHDWILKRVILDDSFLPTLNTLAQTAGDETAIAELRVNVDQQRCIVRQLREELGTANQRAALQRQLLERSVLQRAKATGGGGGIFGIVEDAAGALSGAADKVGDFIFGGGGGSGDAESNRQALQERAQEAADQAREILYRLEREVTALNALTETFAKALREHHTHLTEIARLENHVRDNIFKYMHDVWTFEPADQRYFRLHNVPIPVFHATSRAYTIDFDNPLPTGPEPPHKTLSRFGGQDLRSFAYESKTKIGEQIEFAPLSQVADLDTLLGFKGNYMIFPLLESNALTDFLMDPFVDRATGQLVDPSDPINWSIDEYTQYVCCLKDKLTSDELAELLPVLKEMYKTILANATRKDDVLVVPTSSLFIEMLLGENAAIEKFKAAHRAIDVLDAREKVRAQGLESVRRAARILAEEREDPNIDQRVLIQGEVPGVVVPPPDH